MESFKAIICVVFVFFKILSKSKNLSRATSQRSRTAPATSLVKILTKLLDI